MIWNFIWWPNRENQINFINYRPNLAQNIEIFIIGTVQHIRVFRDFVFFRTSKNSDFAEKSYMLYCTYDKNFMF
jgi:hypothetical protein